MIYCLIGLLMYPNLTQQAQNQVCIDDSNQNCVGDIEIKEGLSIAALVTVIGTFCVAIWLTFHFVREKHDSKRARAIITSEVNRLESSNLEAFEEDVLRTANQVSTISLGITMCMTTTLVFVATLFIAIGIRGCGMRQR